MRFQFLQPLTTCTTTTTTSHYVAQGLAEYTRTTVATPKTTTPSVLPPPLPKNLKSIDAKERRREGGGDAGSRSSHGRIDSGNTGADTSPGRESSSSNGPHQCRRRRNRFFCTYVFSFLLDSFRNRCIEEHGVGMNVGPIGSRLETQARLRHPLPLRRNRPQAYGRELRSRCIPDPSFFPSSRGSNMATRRAARKGSTASARHRLALHWSTANEQVSAAR